MVEVILLLGAMPWILLALSLMEWLIREILHWLLCLGDEYAPEMSTDSKLYMRLEERVGDVAVPAVAKLTAIGFFTAPAAAFTAACVQHHPETTLPILTTLGTVLGVMFMVRYLARRLWQHQGKLVNHEERITTLEEKK